MHSSYVIYELLIRLQEIDPTIGEYQSYKKIKAGIIVLTTIGTFEISDQMLDLQFHNPDAVAASDLKEMLGSFQERR
jgi:hypothetical protein